VDLDHVMVAVEDHFQQLELTALILKRRIYVSSADDAMPKKIKKM